jgi:di/tricarboxylate transporter
VVDELTEHHLRRDRALIALAIIALVVGLTVFNVVSILVAAMLGAVAMVLGRCITIDEAYQAVDWKVVFLLGGMLPLGRALETSGASAWLAANLLGPLADAGPLVILAALYIVTAMLTEVMSNNAAAVLLAPIAISISAGMGISPRPLLIAITFAASTSFATPVGYQTNTLVYAPGGYRFTDFTKVGLPLNLVFWLLAVLLIPLVWPF